MSSKSAARKLSKSTLLRMPSRHIKVRISDRSWSSLRKKLDFTDNVNVPLWRMLKSILRYLKGTLGFSIIFPFTEKHNNPQLCVYSDSSFADLPDRRSSYGYLILFDEYLISWSASALKSVVTSTTEAEYLASSISCKQALALREMWREISNANIQISLFTDSRPSLGWLTNSSKQHRKVKHIDVAFRFIEQFVNSSEITVSIVTSENQPADLMTKSVSPNTLQKLLFLLPVRFGEVLKESLTN